MASASGAVWAIDIGNYSLKALRLNFVGDRVEVIDFDNIRHGKILSVGSVSAAERDEIVALSVRQFLSKNDLSKDDIIVSVPSQNSFARFVSLPPVDAKRIPEIVRFEAVQQIPFDINDVQWDWQLMDKQGREENRVGIFAIKNDVVTSELEHFSRENIQVNLVQMAPMALYNFILYDHPELFRTADQAVVLLNVGAKNSDLVICTAGNVWQRCIPMGGNSFTQAIAEAFKLNFEKAEKLKRTATMSKYARQILQAMKPVFSDLASEIQRSMGFYSSSNPNTKLTKIIAMGGGTNMRGLLKYLQQSLQMPVERPDSFKRMAISSEVSAAKFHDSVCDFGIVYGLALQGLGLCRIESNLLPKSIARSMLWAGKTKYFILAACLLLAVSIFSLMRTFFDKANYGEKEDVRSRISRIISEEEQAIKKLKSEEKKASASAAIIEKEFGLFKNREVIPLLCQTLIEILPNENNTNDSAQKEFYRAFVQRQAQKVIEMPRKNRKQIFLTGMTIEYVDDISVAKLSDVSKKTGTGKQSASRGSRGGSDRTKAVSSAPVSRSTRGGRATTSRQSRSKSRKGTDKTGRSGQKGSSKEDDSKNMSGFLVEIIGYSPYMNIGELLDPAGVGDDREQWGYITRMMHLDEALKHKVPFELYEKTSIEHFNLEKGEVVVGGLTPLGIGIEQSRRTESSRSVQPGRRSRISATGLTDTVLVDPLTDEVISKVPRRDSLGVPVTDKEGKTVYEVNDHWFVLRAKFRWKEAPKG